MAPSSGHLLVPKTWRILKFALQKTTAFLRTKAPQAARSATADLQPAFVRTTTRHPIPRIAALRQQQSRGFASFAHSAVVRGFTSSAKTTLDRSALPKSRISKAVNQLTRSAPFASTLRPNLTGGTLARTAGGYGLGSGRVGGVRYFSHTPAAPAQVINNVSAAVRAFWISGSKAQFDGVSPATGEKRYRCVSALREESGRKLQSVPKSAPGSYIEFQISPTLTAFGPLNHVQGGFGLAQENLLDMLSVDFARALKDLAMITNDLKKLSNLGDLPLFLHDKATLRVRFPGCDAGTVERLCDEVGVQRGVIRQDDDFDDCAGVEMALLFPFAPSRCPSEPVQPAGRQHQDEIDWRNMLSDEESATSPGFSKHSDAGLDYEVVGQNPWLSSPSGYSSLHESDGEVAEYFEYTNRNVLDTSYEGLEGIHRFLGILEECDQGRR